ncbi:MAG: hypothetical protein ACYDG4_15080 [Desulfuromonadaceae bacterium]
MADTIYDLTETQERFIAIVGIELFYIQARLAGAENIPERRKKQSGDKYGDMLARREQMKELEEEFLPNLQEYVNKPL